MLFTVVFCLFRYSVLPGDCHGDGVWGGVELEAFEKVMETFEAATGIEVGI